MFNGPRDNRRPKGAIIIPARLIDSKNDRAFLLARQIWLLSSTDSWIWCGLMTGCQKENIWKPAYRPIKGRRNAAAKSFKTCFQLSLHDSQSPQSTNISGPDCRQKKNDHIMNVLRMWSRGSVDLNNILSSNNISFCRHYYTIRSQVSPTKRGPMYWEDITQIKNF